MVDTVVLCTGVITQGAQSHLCCSALESAHWYTMLPKAEEDEDSDSDGSEEIATEEGEDMKKTDFEVGGVSMHNTREVGNMMNSKFSNKAHHVSVREQAVHVWGRRSSMRYVM